ncbi:hypothetical protein Syn8016DRAFT_1112 [Synechococcus sp. WH 8016]|nr:hypothetical protein Syn8016DRAFT_1112 [Synechococcus sp. WH 8016]
MEQLVLLDPLLDRQMQKHFNPVLKDEALDELLKRFDESAPTAEEKLDQKSKVTPSRSLEEIRAAYWGNQ